MKRNREKCCKRHHHHHHFIFRWTHQWVRVETCSEYQSIYTQVDDAVWRAWREWERNKYKKCYSFHVCTLNFFKCYYSRPRCQMRQRQSAEKEREREWSWKKEIFDEFNESNASLMTNISMMSESIDCEDRIVNKQTEHITHNTIALEHLDYQCVNCGTIETILNGAMKSKSDSVCVFEFECSRIPHQSHRSHHIKVK